MPHLRRIYLSRLCVTSVSRLVSFPASVLPVPFNTLRGGGSRQSSTLRTHTRRIVYLLIHLLVRSSDFPLWHSLPPVLFPFFLLFPRTVYTLLPRGYLERHGGKTQRAGAGASAQGEVTSEDESDSGARAAERKEGNGGEDEVEIEAALSSDADRASRWLLSSDEASDDIAFMRVSRAVLSRGVLYRIAGFRLRQRWPLTSSDVYYLRMSSIFQCPFFFLLLADLRSTLS